MGNTNPNLGRGTGDLGNTAMKGWPVLFHLTHSENVQLSLDRRKAKRVESFCKGISFSDRSIAVNERVYVRFAEVSTSWSGVIRFGFTSQDPATINGAELPRYACPDLTNKPGFWAKALPERYSEQNNIICFYANRGGEVVYSMNGDDKGVFFGGVSTSGPLWAIIDIYGNTTAMEFLDGRQLNNLTSPAPGLQPGNTVSTQDLSQSLQAVTVGPPQSPGVQGGQSASMPALPMTGPAVAASPANQLIGPLPSIRYHVSSHFHPMPFHHVMGRNVCLSSDRTVAVRLLEEYCNGYVFTHRPLCPGEKIVIQVLAVVPEFSGGLTFGMTAADPVTINIQEMPDDSDLLLDRPEYWVVNKDVCTSPEVGDELSFHLTLEGEVRYGKNNHHIASLMHVDKTLPMWAFVDMYGHTQKIKSLGVLSSRSSPAQRNSGQHPSGLTVTLPPSRTPSGASLAGLATPPNSSSNVTPPPRPPPPRSSPSAGSGSSGGLGRVSPPVSRRSPVPPSLPPKQYRPPSTGSMMTNHPAAALMQASGASGSLPPPLIPTPISSPGSNLVVHPSPSPPPVPGPRGAAHVMPSTTPSHPTPSLSELASPIPRPQSQLSLTDETADNECNECKVCMYNAVDTVLYTCGHMCLCFECAKDIRNKQNLCPMCRQPIVDIIKIYRS